MAALILSKLSKSSRSSPGRVASNVTAHETVNFRRENNGVVCSNF